MSPFEEMTEGIPNVSIPFIYKPPLVPNFSYKLQEVSYVNIARIHLL